MTALADQTLRTLLRALADGEFHSGEELGALLGVSRAAVWKQLQKLEGLGLVVESVRGRGYRLSRALDLLDVDVIKDGLAPKLRQNLQLTSFLQTDSTSVRAMEAASGAAHGHAFIAEQQTAGRGRRGRAWVSPFGSNIYLSLVWGFQGGAAALSGLSLAVGVACARMLRASGADQVALKWPNDLLVDGKKLGGILLEMTGDPAGECQVVIGIGINVAMPSEQAQGIDQAWVDLRSLGVTLSRNALVAKLLTELVAVLERFALEGFAGFRAEWLALDAFANQAVTLSSAASSVSGIAQGVDDSGALIVWVDGQMRLFHGGELSLRAAGAR
ncbi:bifunctional biotin--[acetyl-CoA-carboxylase] ligase/biotin operon repressor BirA [Simiduia curdlanivorans]|uniref:Bifunctional ligase/repressor BirA n=1 Tax=Simiduia curdlanivorans TaxID=1492769 RepID=A0ABV8V514_9GAMM|nr:bifunctional biotin--[acetyl-CoA-carboxylase] ligase/biotin operon repressor BirA [Simiduia curdlanivorans]MDN3638423.1 bifunctional biotin--[acetyl-CoA-carboxylase] ligase/biotin operon repressor BirA [Simiduia curdlanivorans]